MKKLVVILLIALLLLSITACSGSEKTESSTAQGEVTEATTEAKVTTATTAEETTTGVSDLAGLADQELVKSVMANFKEPQSLYAKFKITAAELSMDMNMIYYVNGKSHKTSMDMLGQGVYNHTMYLAEDSYVYSYTDGETEGYKYLEDSTDLEDEFIDLSFGEEDFEEIEDLAEAKIESIDGRECLYMRFIEDDGVSNEMWLSLEHSFPVRMIISGSEDGMDMQMDVVEIESNKDFSSEFVVPADITFIE